MFKRRHNGTDIKQQLEEGLVSAHISQMDVSSSKRCQGGWSEKTHQSEWMHPTGSCDFHHCTVGSSSLTESSHVESDLKEAQSSSETPTVWSRWYVQVQEVKSQVFSSTFSQATEKKIIDGSDYCFHTGGRGSWASTVCGWSHEFLHGSTMLCILPEWFSDSELLQKSTTSSPLDP